MTTRGGAAPPSLLPPVPAGCPSRLSTPAMAAAVRRALRVQTKRQTSWTCGGMGNEGRAGMWDRMFRAGVHFAATRA